MAQKEETVKNMLFENVSKSIVNQWSLPVLLNSSILSVSDSNRKNDKYNKKYQSMYEKTICAVARKHKMSINEVGQFYTFSPYSELDKRLRKIKDTKVLLDFIRHNSGEKLDVGILLNKFKKADNEKDIYIIGSLIPNISFKEYIKIKNKKFKQIKDEEIIYLAGRDWSQIDKNVLNKKFIAMKNPDYIIKAGSEWTGLRSPSLKKQKKYIISMNNEQYIVEMFRSWKIKNQIKEISDLFYNLKDENMIIEAGRDWHKLPVRVINDYFLSIDANRFNLILQSGKQWFKIIYKNKIAKINSMIHILDSYSLNKILESWNIKNTDKRKILANFRVENKLLQEYKKDRNKKAERTKVVAV